MKKTTERPLLEAALENAEAIVDALSSDSVLTEIPVVGTALKICRAADSVRNRVFTAKLERFLEGLSHDHDRLAKEWKKKLVSKPEETKAVGETVFMTLERLADMKIAEYISYLFRAYVDDVITSSELQRLSQAIDLAFISDLDQLLQTKKFPEKSQDAWLRHLVPAGLAETTGSQIINEAGTIYYKVTNFGRKLQNAYFHGRKGA
jgi:hypothetical protein